MGTPPRREGLASWLPVGARGPSVPLIPEVACDYVVHPELWAWGSGRPL